MRTLQYNAPSHNFEHTTAALKRALQQSVGNAHSFESVFLEIDAEPLASASIAQVHRAIVQPPGCKESIECVCKVRHPNVKELLERDLSLVALLFKVGKALNVPFAGIVDVDALVAELRPQCCLETEIKPMQEFGANFALSKNIKFPQPFDWCKSDEVVVETRLQGVRYEQLPSSLERGSVRDLCKRMTMGAYLHMIFLDGLIHGDCHGGNVLYSVKRKDGKEDHKRGEEEEEGGRGEKGKIKALSTKSTFDPEDMYQGALDHETFDFNAQVAFCDFGVISRVSLKQKHAFIELINSAFAKDVKRFVATVRQLVTECSIADGGKKEEGEGEEVEEERVEKSQLTAIQEEGLRCFEREFDNVLGRMEQDDSSVGKMMNELLSLLQMHELRIDGNMVRIIVNFILIEEDYGYGKFNNVFDNTVRYILYNDEHRDFDALIDPVSDFFANHYAVRHGAKAPAARAIVGTDESVESLQEIVQKEIVGTSSRRIKKSN